MKIEFSKAAASLTGIGVRKPSITGATRLETQPTSVGMLNGLRAPLADPLWLLARQWQFNEFQGEDAGTPLRVKFAVQGTAVDAFRSGADAQQRPWQPLEPHSAPAETRVEAEPVWRTHPRLRGEAGLHALRMASAALRAALLAKYALTIEAPSDPVADQAGLLWSAVFGSDSPPAGSKSGTIDAAALATDLAPLLDAAGALTALPAGLAIGAAEEGGARKTLAQWLAWFNTLVYEGSAGDSSWQRNRMEYAFALRAGDLALEADEYTDGHLDWDDLRVAAPVPGAQPFQQAFAVATRHPSPVIYPGMPAQRYWEFEDGDVNFAGAEAGITDLLRMSVTEFALTFGNDWFLVPVRLPVGWLYQVATFEITDSFGITAAPSPISNPDGTRWTLYELTAPATDANLRQKVTHTMLLPDSVEVQEGVVLEDTLLARDEMANLAWAIEQRVQGVSGEPVDRNLEARGLSFQQQIHFDQQPDSPQAAYRLATPVPANWTPLLPVRDPVLNLADPLTIRLTRAGMKRFYPEASVQVLGAVDPDYVEFLNHLDAQDSYVTRLPIGADLRAYVFYPRGWLLRRDPTQPMPADDTLLIEEEEVPRIGARLKRKFQYARSSDGQRWLWIGRNKIAGRGEAASNLRFDVTEKTSTSR